MHKMQPEWCMIHWLLRDVYARSLGLKCFSYWEWEEDNIGHYFPRAYFHPLEIVSRFRDPQLQVGEKHSHALPLFSHTFLNAFLTSCLAIGPGSLSSRLPDAPFLPARLLSLSADVLPSRPFWSPPWPVIAARLSEAAIFWLSSSCGGSLATSSWALSKKFIISGQLSWNRKYFNENIFINLWRKRKTPDIFKHG